MMLLRNHRSRFVALLSLLFLQAHTLLARDIFVDNMNGENRNNGSYSYSAGRGNGPVRTINKALKLCMPGDAIILAHHEGEPYREMVTLCGRYHSGTDTSPTRIYGNGAVLEGLHPVESVPWEPIGNDRFSIPPRLVNPQTLFFGDKRAPQPLSRDQVLARATMSPGQWYYKDGLLVLQCAKDSLPESLFPRIASLSVGITLVDVHDVEIMDLKVHGFQLDGINAHDGVTRTNLSRLTTTGCGRSGISVGGASRVRIEECTSQDNLQSQLRTEGLSQVLSSGNTFTATEGSLATQTAGGTITEEQP